MFKFVLVLIMATFVHNVLAKDFYVSPDGDNNNNGSIDHPWKTIQFGIYQLEPGDILNIRAGKYEEKIDVDVSGTEAKKIIIKNYQNEVVVLDAINSDNDLPIVYIDNSNIRVEGLVITNNIINYAGGIAIQGAAKNIEIVNNKISNIKFSADPNAEVTSEMNAVPLGVYADLVSDSCSNILIQGNEVFNNQTGYSENISLGGNLSGFVVKGNIVHDNTNIGIDIGGNYETCSNPDLDHGRYGLITENIVYNCNAAYSTAAGIYIDGGWNIVVERNIAHHNGYGGEIGCEENGSTKNIIYRNNIFYKNAFCGMHIGGYDEKTTGIVLNSKIHNNTFYKNDTHENYNGELIFTKLDKVDVFNNIFYISSQNLFLYAERTQKDLWFDYNLVFSESGASSILCDGNFETEGLDDYYQASGYGSHSSFGNPLFASNTDFQISKESAAIDAGDPSFSSENFDFKGNERVNGIVDCGAFEFYTTIGLKEELKNDWAIYPNPVSEKLYVKHAENADFELFTTLGQMVLKGKILNRSIDVSTLKKGVYLLKIDKKVELIFIQ